MPNSNGSGGGGFDRDVVVGLRIQLDKNNATTFRSAGKQVKDYEDGVRKEAEATEKWRGKLRENSIKQMHQLYEKSEKEAQKLRDAGDREEDRIHQRGRQRQLQRARDSRSMREQQAKEEERLAERTASAHTRATSKLIQSTTRGAFAVTELARAFVYLGASSEQSAQKALQAIFKVEAAVGAVRGGANLARMVRGLYQAAELAGPGSAAAMAAGALPIAAGAAVIGGIGALAANSYIGNGGQFQANQNQTDAMSQRFINRVSGEGKDQDFASQISGVESQGRLALSHFAQDSLGVVSNRTFSPGTVAAQQNSLALSERIATAPIGVGSAMAAIQGQADLSASERQLARDNLDNQSNALSNRLRAAKDIALDDANKLAAKADATPRVYRDQPTTEYQNWRNSISGSSPGALGFRAHEFWNANSWGEVGSALFGGQFSEKELQKKYEQQTGKTSFDHLMVSGMGADADKTNALKEAQDAQQQIRDIQQDQLRIKEQQVQLDKQSVDELKKQHDQYLGIVAAESARMFANKEKFALMGKGQQNRLLRDLDKYNAGQSLGPGRSGLRHEIALVQSGLIDSDSARFQRDINGAVPGRAFAAPQQNIDNAMNHARDVGKQIADGSKQGLKDEDLVEDTKREVKRAIHDLADAMIEALDDVRNTIVRKDGQRRSTESGQRAAMNN
jgi:hypothetical protein